MLVLHYKLLRLIENDWYLMFAKDMLDTLQREAPGAFAICNHQHSKHRTCMFNHKEFIHIDADRTKAVILQLKETYWQTDN